MLAAAAGNSARRSSAQKESKKVWRRYKAASPDSDKFLFPFRKSQLRTEDLQLIGQRRAEEFLFLFEGKEELETEGTWMKMSLSSSWSIACYSTSVISF